jgi:hypothetical protein
VAELGIVLALIGALVGYLRADVSLITVAVVLALISCVRQRVRG